jgi:hypothetical protein
MLLSLFSAIPEFINKIAGMFTAIENRGIRKEANERRKEKDDEVEKRINDIINGTGKPGDGGV